MIYESHEEIKNNFPFILHTDTVINKFPCPLHWHDNLEILNCIEGSGTVIVDAHPIKIDKGSTIIINRGFSHTILSNEMVRYNCLIIDDEFLKNIANIPETFNFTSLIYDDMLTTHLCNIVKEYNEQNVGYELAIKANILSALSIIYRLSGETIYKTDNTNIQQAIKYIKNHFHEDISLDDIAASVSLSKSYFIHKFKEYTGCTVNEYLRSVRCKHAKHLLRHPNASVTEVAFQCGFSDVSYFTKVFKKNVGILPSKYKTQKNPD